MIKTSPRTSVKDKISENLSESKKLVKKLNQDEKQRRKNFEEYWLMRGLSVGEEEKPACLAALKRIIKPLNMSKSVKREAEMEYIMNDPMIRSKVFNNKSSRPVVKLSKTMKNMLMKTFANNEGISNSFASIIGAEEKKCSQVELEKFQNINLAQTVLKSMEKEISSRVSKTEGSPLIFPDGSEFPVSNLEEEIRLENRLKDCLFDLKKVQESDAKEKDAKIIRLKSKIGRIATNGEIFGESFMLSKSADKEKRSRRRLEEKSEFEYVNGVLVRTKEDSVPEGSINEHKLILQNHRQVAADKLLKKAKIIGEYFNPSSPKSRLVVPSKLNIPASLSSISKPALGAGQPSSLMCPTIPSKVTPSMKANLSKREPMEQTMNQVFKVKLNERNYFKAKLHESEAARLAFVAEQCLKDTKDDLKKFGSEFTKRVKYGEAFDSKLDFRITKKIFLENKPSKKPDSRLSPR